MSVIIWNKRYVFKITQGDPTTSGKIRFFWTKIGLLIQNAVNFDLKQFWCFRTLWALFVLAQITFLALAYFSFKQSQATNELLKKVILQNGLSQIHWNLNGLNQDDPILIQKIKNDILIPPNPHQTLTLKDPPETNESGQYGQVSRIEKILGLSKNNPKSGFFIEAGAADGEWFSNTLYFERHHGWTGLLVEPNPDLLSDLVKTHR